MGKNVTVKLTGVQAKGEVGSVETRKEYYQKHKGAATTVIVLSILSPFIGLFLAGWAGVIVAIILSGIAYYFGPKAATKIIEITKSHA